MVRSAWSICRDLALAEELAQEAFVKAYRRWAKLDEGGYAEPWLHRVVMNLALDTVRRASRGRVLEASVARGHLALVPGPQLPDEAVEVLRRLPKRQREAVFLRVIADLPEDEVARVMGCSVGSVKTHKSRGLAQLRELLDQGEEVRGGHGTATEAAHG